jgi:hypothetical protein
MGSATLRQKVLPFNRTLERFGQHAIQGPNRYDVDAVSVGTAPATDWALVQEHFAPADFEELNETEKLSRASFEPMDAGVKVGGDFVDGPLGELKVAELEYETRIVDSPWDGRALPRFRLDRLVQLATVLRGSTVRSVFAQTGPTKFAATEKAPPAVTLAAEEYAVATVDTLAPRPDVARGVAKGAALRALKDVGETDRLQVVPAHELEGSA